jgi:hypothetical protein
MKKKLMVLVVLMLTVVMIGANFGHVSAMRLPPSSPDPVVTPVSGDPDFTADVISIASLPGVTNLDDGMLAPAGFPAGEKQFGGNGVRISGLEGGVVSVCFALKGATVGWGGQVAKWTGSSWQLLPSSTSAPDESSNSWVCANVSANGTYAFLKWVVDVSLLPSKKEGCSFDTSEWTGGYYDDYYFYAQFPPDFPEDIDATYTVLETTGAIDLEGEFTDTASTYYASWDDVVYADFENYPFTFEGDWTATLLINAAGCSKTIVITSSDYYDD